VSDDDSDGDSSPRRAAVNDASHTEQQTRPGRRRLQEQEQRNQKVVKKRRRRIVQTADSSTDDDLDASNNNHLPSTPTSKPCCSTDPQSITAADTADRKLTIPSPTSSQANALVRPSLIRSGESDSVNRSVQSKAVHPAVNTGPDRTNIIGGLGQPSLVNRPILSNQSLVIHPAEFMQCFSNRDDAPMNVQLENSAHHVQRCHADKIANTPTANDVPTFSLAFDDFLQSEGEDSIADHVTEYTRLKPSNGYCHFPSEKPNDESPAVGFSRAVASCRSTIQQSDCTTGSGQLGLSGSGQPNSVKRSLPSVQSKTATSVSYDSALPQSDCETGSGERDLTRSRQPTVTSSAQSEAEKLREERLRLSRLKKEEFQKKYVKRTLSSSQQCPSSTPLGTVDTAGVDNMTKLRILVDSRELAGAQVH